MRFAIENWLRRWRFGGRRTAKRVRQAAACLSLSLATAWAAPTDAAIVHLEVAPTESLTQAFVIYNNYVLNSSAYVATFALGDLVGGLTTTFDHEIPDWTVESLEGPGAGYMLFALHGPPGNRGVSMSFPDDSLITSHGSWDSFIASTYGSNGYTPEQFIVDTWGVNWASTLSISFPNRVHLPFGTIATIVNMSDAAYGGTAIATVPEPGSCVLLVTGAGVLLGYAWRRRS